MLGFIEEVTKSDREPEPQVGTAAKCYLYWRAPAKRALAGLDHELSELDFSQDGLFFFRYRAGKLPGKPGQLPLPVGLDDGQNLVFQCVHFFTSELGKDPQFINPAQNQLMAGRDYPHLQVATKTEKFLNSETLLPVRR